MEGSPCAVSAMPSRTSQNMMCRTTLSPATSPTPLFTPVPPVRRMSAQERLWSDTLHPVQSPKPLAALSINLDQNVKPVSVPSAMRNLYLPFLGLSSPDDLKIYMLHGVDALTCSICQNFSHKSKYTLQNHIESKHFPNTFVYTCPKCQKNVSTREALICHKKRCSSY